MLDDHYRPGIQYQTLRHRFWGHVGLMCAEEYESTYQAQNYSMDATVGKDGME